MSVLSKVGQFIFIHRSAIFMGAGLALGAACVGTVAVQTIKACDIIDNANNQLDEVESLEGDISEDEMIAKTKEIRKSTNLQLVKNYIVPVTFGIGSVVCILAAYRILSSQKAAALASLASVTAAFDTYRSRVVEKYGAEEDYNLYMGKTTTEVTKEYTDPKTGKTKTKKETVTSLNPIDGSCYSREFSSDTSKEWCFNQKLCIERLQHFENWLNEELLKKGRISYNEVLEQLGLDCRVGYYATQRPIPNGIGWCSKEILDAVADKYPGPYDDKIKFAPHVTKEYFDDGITHYDGSYMLHFNCYPIDGMVEYYRQKLESGKIKRPE